MVIVKSSRHQKVIGSFGEWLVCNWLSRSGFEAAIVDHTGLDIIAYNLSTGKRLGITVKSRTRVRGKEEGSVNLFFNEKGDREKLLRACKAFGCEPWIAVYVETEDYGDLYLTSLENYDAKYRGNRRRKIDDWKMSKRARRMYQLDPKVKHLHIKFYPRNWPNVESGMLSGSVNF